MPVAVDINNHNPLGTAGFEFVEFASPKPEHLIELFTQLGFTAVSKHRTKDVIRFTQGDINFLINKDQQGHPFRFTNEHGPCANAMAFRVTNGQHALTTALQCGAKQYHREKVSAMELNIPAIYGIGGSLLFLVDCYSESTIYDHDFVPLLSQHVESTKSDASKHFCNTLNTGLIEIDHLTHNVHRGNMNHWARFYEKIFNFQEIRYFDIKGKHTGLVSRAMTSPCGKIRIPINESSDENSQIEEYLSLYKGEGIQHIALSTNDIFHTVSVLRSRGVEFLSVPDSYYTMIDARLHGHGESIEKLREHRILIDGQTGPIGKELLLQIFTKPLIGPIFFEIIQRKGDEGFGEGNFQALFEAMERDQMDRGFLTPDK